MQTPLVDFAIFGSRPSFRRIQGESCRTPRVLMSPSSRWFWPSHSWRDDEPLSMSLTTARVADRQRHQENVAYSVPQSQELALPHQLLKLDQPCMRRTVVKPVRAVCSE